MSGQSPFPSLSLVAEQTKDTSVASAEDTLNQTVSLDRASGSRWDRGKRTWLMAETCQKLKKAVRRGIRELQWQRFGHFFSGVVCVKKCLATQENM